MGNIFKNTHIVLQYRETDLLAILYSVQIISMRFRFPIVGKVYLFRSELSRVKGDTFIELRDFLREMEQVRCCLDRG